MFTQDDDNHLNYLLDVALAWNANEQRLLVSASSGAQDIGTSNTDANCRMYLKMLYSLVHY